MQATFAEDVDHAVSSMLLAVRRRLDANQIVHWALGAEGMRATLVPDVHHSILGVFLAVRRRHATFDVEVRLPHAEVGRVLEMFTMPSSA